MKRVIYSYAAKTIAFLLVIASAALGSYKAVELLTAIENEYGVYHFESDFYESDVFNNALVAPFGIMMNIDYDNEEEKRMVGNMLRSAGAEYYMEADGVVIMSNTQNTDPAYYENSKYSLTMEKNAGEEAVFGGGMSDRITESFMNGVYYDFQNRSDSDECRIYIRLDETCVRDIETVWYQGQRLTQDSLIYCFCSMIVCAAALIYLLCVCGRSSKDNDIHMLLIDRMFVEITAGLTIIASFCTAGAVITLADALLSTNSVEKMLLLCIPITAAAGMGLVTALLMSLVRNAKTGAF